MARRFNLEALVCLGLIAAFWVMVALKVLAGVDISWWSVTAPVWGPVVTAVGIGLGNAFYDAVRFLLRGSFQGLEELGRKFSNLWRFR